MNVIAGQPRVGDVVMVRVKRGGDSPRRVRAYPARVHTVHEHARVAFARVAGTRIDAARVVYADRHHTADCTYCDQYASK